MSETETDEERDRQYESHGFAEMDRLQAELAEVTAERDRLREERDALIERWPDDQDDSYRPIESYECEETYQIAWEAVSPHKPESTTRQIETFSDRTAAVRFAAGLQPLTPEAR